MRSLGKDELRGGLDFPARLERRELAHQHGGVQNDAIADDARLVAVEDAAWDEGEDRLLPIHHQGVPGVVAALEAHHHLGALGEQVDHLALALVAPLGAHHHHVWHASSPAPIAPAPRGDNGSETRTPAPRRRPPVDVRAGPRSPAAAPAPRRQAFRATTPAHPASVARRPARRRRRAPRGSPKPRAPRRATAPEPVTAKASSPSGGGAPGTMRSRCKASASFHTSVARATRSAGPAGRTSSAEGAAGPRRGRP